MPNFKVLGTGTNVDPTKASGWKNLGWLVVGASVLFFVLNLGQAGGGWLTGMFSNLTGVGTSESSGITESFGGGF